MERAMPRKKTRTSRAKAEGKRKPKSKTTLKKKARKIRTAPKKKKLKKRIPGRENSADMMAYKTRGLGANSAGQSGDTQGLPGTPVGDSESVEELLEEGQTFEAEVLEGVENARDADKSEVKTRQVSEDDVPEEYRGKD
jgi:hypothetical protein